MSAHFASLKGERSCNEDGHNIILGLLKEDDTKAKVDFYGVYDGHGGKFVSKFLQNNIYHFFINKCAEYPLKKKYVQDVYNKIQGILSSKYSKQAMECGSTCLIVCHFKINSESFLNIINLGDSRCVLCRNNIAKTLTVDHKPNWPSEFNRISKLGGKIRKDGNTYRINDLSVSRAFGDLSASQYVTHMPDLYKYKVKPSDRFIIIACDGLWDVLSPQDAVNFVIKNCYDTDMKRINHKINISHRLADLAIKKDCGDNVTCIVVFF